MQAIDGEINSRLQMLSSLTIDCNRLNKMDVSRIQQTITELRVELIELRTRMVDRAQLLQQQAQLKSRTDGQENDVQQSRSDLLKWFHETRKTAAQQADVSADSSIPQDSQVCHRVSNNFLSHFVQTLMEQ